MSPLIKFSLLYKNALIKKTNLLKKTANIIGIMLSSLRYVVSIKQTSFIQLRNLAIGALEIQEKWYQDRFKEPYLEYSSVYECAPFYIEINNADIKQKVHVCTCSNTSKKINYLYPCYLDGCVNRNTQSMWQNF